MKPQASLGVQPGEKLVERQKTEAPRLACSYAVTKAE